jgi:HEAT repeats
VKRPFLALAALSTLLCAAPAWSAEKTVTLAGSSLEHALVAQISGAEVRAASCRNASGCRVDGGSRYTIPADADAGAATAETIELTSGRRLALISVPFKSGQGRWTLLLAASDKKSPPAVDKKLSGAIERPTGLEGEQRYKLLIREKSGSGEALRSGRRYENAGVCGRPSTMKVHALDPYELVWNGGPTESLTTEERQKAPVLTATPSSEPWPADAPRILRGKLASSAVARSRSALTDGDLGTRWAERRPGAGQGEFLVMDTSNEIAIAGFDVVLRPSKDHPGGAAPKSFFLATRGAVFKVAIPSDAYAGEPGAIFRVTLPEALKTDCVALVLDASYGKGDQQVGIAELRARTAFDDKTMADLVAALDDPAQADAASNVLLRNEARGVKAAIDAFGGLTPDGRRHALDVIGTGPCTQTAPFYVDRVLGEGAGPDFDPALDRMARYARDRLRQCRTQAATALDASMKSAGPGQTRVWAARELADIAPQDAVRAILGVLEEGSTAPAEPGGKDEVRRGLRGSLATAAKHPRAKDAVGELLGKGFAALTLVQKIDLLRAVGAQLGEQPQGATALAAAQQQDAGFRTRYLLMEPTAHLAKAGNAVAVGTLRSALIDDNPHLRARAAAVAGGVNTLAAELQRALADGSPRVRRAALMSVTEEGQPVTVAVEGELARLLRDDDWTFVRQEAARALAKRPPTPTTDAALVSTLEGAPNRVRVAALNALGQRGSLATAEAVVALADAAKEPVYVRTAAIKAIAAMCHRDSTELLYKLALRAGYQQLPYDQPLGLAALKALGVIRPPDMAKQLRPMLARNRIVPPQIRAIVRSILGQAAKPCTPR